MNFDDTGIVEYELEKLRNESRTEVVSTVRSKFNWKWMFLFFAGMILFKIFGDFLKFII